MQWKISTRISFLPSQGKKFTPQKYYNKFEKHAKWSSISRISAACLRDMELVANSHISRVLQALLPRVSNTGREHEGARGTRKEGRKIERGGKGRKDGRKRQDTRFPRRGAVRSGWQRDDARGNSRFVQEPVDVPTRRQAGTHRSANRDGALSALHNVAADDDNVDNESFSRKLSPTCLTFF